jgi:hypothetical protein
MLGCIITALLILTLNYFPLSLNTRHYLFDAELISFSDNILEVKGLPYNNEYTNGTYFINISDDLLLEDWETYKNLEWGAVKDYKYITLEYTGHEELHNNTYLKNVKSIYCNVDKRIP